MSCGEIHYLEEFEIGDKVISICWNCSQNFRRFLCNKFDSNIMNEVKFRNGRLTISGNARLVLKNYFEMMIEPYGRSIKKNITLLNDVEVMEYITQQTIRNKYDELSGLNVWSIRKYIKKFSSTQRLSVKEFMQAIKIIEIFESDFNIDIWNELDFKSK